MFSASNYLVVIIYNVIVSKFPVKSFYKSDKNIWNKKNYKAGQWLWRSCFRHQRSAVQIPTSAIFYLPNVQLNRKDKNREKEAGNGASKKNNMNSLKFNQKITLMISKNRLCLFDILNPIMFSKNLFEKK